MIRWLTFIRYPQGISVEDGDRWFLGTYAQEAKQLNGLCRYLTWKSEDPPEYRGERSWHRLTEMGFRDWPSLREAVANAPAWTPPPWGPSVEMESVFVGDRPEYDLMRDLPAIN